MIIFFGGYPFSGKSTVARALAAQLPFVSETIDPKTLRSDDYDKLNETVKREQNLSVWEVSLDLLSDQIEKNADSSILIYDTACANLPRMKPLFEKAAKAGHHVIFIFVVSPLQECMGRAGDKWLSKEVIDRYTKNFKENVNVFKALAHQTFILRNEADVLPDLSEVVDHITKHYG